MRNEDRKLLTLEERLELAAKSQAASPESAACMVRRIFCAEKPIWISCTGRSGNF